MRRFSYCDLLLEVRASLASLRPHPEVRGHSRASKDEDASCTKVRQSGGRNGKIREAQGPIGTRRLVAKDQATRLATIPALRWFDALQRRGPDLRGAPHRHAV